MAAGPLTGTAAPTGARYVVTTKSPLTGAITCSNSGGNFPAELKKSGHDAIILEGASPRPVYLWIGHGAAELRPAEHLWGRSVPETDELLRRETDPKAKTAVIGPAGERKVLFAAIMNDRDRAAGRAGVGAVMGSKNLKAVAVKGDGEVSLADPEAFKAVNARYRDAFKAKTKDNPPALRTHGTAITSVGTQAHGVFPTRNFQQGTFEGWEAIGGEELTRKYSGAPQALLQLPDRLRPGDARAGRPLPGRGRRPGVRDRLRPGIQLRGRRPRRADQGQLPLQRARAGHDQHGLRDRVRHGALREGGSSTEADSGMPLRWGDGPSARGADPDDGHAREGSATFSPKAACAWRQRYGRPELAMTSKGLDFAGYDPRGVQGIGAHYATSPIGGSHMRGDTAYFELLGVPIAVDPLTWEDKPPVVVKWQDLFAVIDAAGLCVFFSVRYLVEQDLMVKPVGITELLNGATGAGFTPEEVERVGERIFNAERLFLVAAGFGRAQDTLPPRITREPMPSGPAKGMVCHLEEMLVPYYQLRGWTPEGVPTEEKLRELGLR